MKHTICYFYMLNWRRLINRFGMAAVERRQDRLQLALDVRRERNQRALEARHDVKL